MKRRRPGPMPPRSPFLMCRMALSRWAMKAPKPLPPNFVHAEWITLHDNPDFLEFVDVPARGARPVGPAEEADSLDFSSGPSHSNGPPSTRARRARADAMESSTG